MTTTDQTPDAVRAAIAEYLPEIGYFDELGPIAYQDDPDMWLGHADKIIDRLAQIGALRPVGSVTISCETARRAHSALVYLRVAKDEMQDDEEQRAEKELASALANGADDGGALRPVGASMSEAATSVLDRETRHMIVDKWLVSRLGFAESAGHIDEMIADLLDELGAVPAAVESLMYAALGRLGANGLCIVAIADAIETADTINSEGIGSPAATRIRKCAEAARLAYAPVPDLPITADHVPTKAELRAAAEEMLTQAHQCSYLQDPDKWTNHTRGCNDGDNRLFALIDRLPIANGADDGDLQQDVAVDNTG